MSWGLRSSTIRALRSLDRGIGIYILRQDILRQDVSADRWELTLYNRDRRRE